MSRHCLSNDARWHGSGYPCHFVARLQEDERWRGLDLIASHEILLFIDMNGNHSP